MNTILRNEKLQYMMTKYNYSLASPIPSALIANIASDSGKHGESNILHILVSPLPLRKDNLVVDACAMIFPPTGFFGSAANIEAPST